jgi:predicted O-linked N-acetylglucosamine transferase (SPINDLY family)
VQNRKANEILINARTAFAEGRFKDSSELLQKVLALDPTNSLAKYHLGVIAGMNENFKDALTLIKAGIDGGVADAVAFFNFAAMNHHTLKYGEARIWYNRAIEKDPSYVVAINNLADIEYLFGNLSESEKLCRKAISLDNSFYMSWNNLGNTLKDQGRYAEAAASYSRVLELKPGYAAAHSNLLLCLCYDNTLSMQDIFEQHCRFGETYTVKPSALKTHSAKNTPDRKIRIGWMSADFRTHSVAYFIEPVLRHIDRSVFEVFCYSGVVNPDPVTQRMRAMADVWRDIWKIKDDAAIAAMIANDEIDILIDLHGHSAWNRLPVFQYRPAPLQITHIGYPFTTGLKTIDYRITDAIADPLGQDRYYTEKLFRLNCGFLCYQPPAEAPEITPQPPVTSRGYITFGSFNNLPKLGPDVKKLWSDVLKTVPGSKLMIKTKPMNDPEVRRKIENDFQELGIEPSRLVLTGHAGPISEHLSAYSGIDIALDPFPYNGTTTTCEALWMGVPVISLEGEHHSGRVSTSILARTGLKNLSVSTPEKYVSLAAFLAANPAYLASLRKSLRPAMMSSSLCNAPAYAECLKKAFLEMLRAKKNY